MLFEERAGRGDSSSRRGFLFRGAPRRLMLAVAGAGAVLAAGALWAEGAVKQLDCEIRVVCDSGGNCRQGTGHVAFRMEPVRLDSGGRGDYRLRYGELQADMTALSDAGPFFWTLEQQRNALMPSSETDWLWHQLQLGQTVNSQIRFLECAFQQ